MQHQSPCQLYHSIHCYLRLTAQLAQCRHHIQVKHLADTLLYILACIAGRYRYGGNSSLGLVTLQQLFPVGQSCLLVFLTQLTHELFIHARTSFDNSLTGTRCHVGSQRLDEVVHIDRNTPAVDNDVVEYEQHLTGVLRSLHAYHTHQRVVLQTQRTVQLFLMNTGCSLLYITLASEVHHFET